MKRETRTVHKAAQYMEQALDDDRGACNALWVAQGNHPNSGGRDYRSKLHAKFNAVYPWSYSNFNDLDDRDARDVRVLALCFVAAMIEAGDL